MSPSATIGLLILLLLLVGAMLGPYFWPVSPEAQDLANRLAAPGPLGGTAAHPLG
ncbi:MAG: ABC transporter permease, partial [Chloroflexia bacterium]|nr:ABC transporter permease [Chloroflexia bacterium]